MSAAHEAMVKAVEALMKAGFEPNGHTRMEHVRVPTAKTPVYGKSGGKPVTLGGRMRLAKPGTDLKATVGLRTTVIYRTVAPGLAGVQGVAHHNTKDLGAIVATLADHPT